MSQLGAIIIRPVETSDLAAFYQQQLEPEAIRMAAFAAKDRRDPKAFNVHWNKILSASQNVNRTIIADGEIAGYVACFPQDGGLEVTYWIGKEFWGRGIATSALNQLLELVAERPIFARAATDNHGSLRVLEKSGFIIVGQDQGIAHGRGEETQEYILRLDRRIALGH